MMDSTRLLMQPTRASAIQAWSGWSRSKEILKGKGNVSNTQVVGESGSKVQKWTEPCSSREQKENWGKVEKVIRDKA